MPHMSHNQIIQCSSMNEVCLNIWNIWTHWYQPNDEECYTQDNDAKLRMMMKQPDCISWVHHCKNFPNVCVVLALDSWYYCSGEQGLTVQHSQDCLIFFIQLNHVYKIKQNKVLPPYDTSLYHKVAYFLFFNEAAWGKHWENIVGLWGLALQSNSSNCLVLIPHRQLENYLLGAWKSYSPTPETI